MEKVRLYASLSEPRNSFGMDRRLMWVCIYMSAVAVVLVVLAAMFHSAIIAAIALGVGFAAWEVTKVGKKVYNKNPHAIDEAIAQWNTPVHGDAD